MARDERKRQKSLAKKKQRESRVRKESNVLRNLSPAATVQAMLRGGWYGCHEFGDDGISHIIAVRRTPQGYAACGFLLDLDCLGVKDAYLVRQVDLEAMSERIKSDGGKIVTPEYSLKKIQFAIDEARKIGFEPSSNASLLMAIFGDVDSSICTDQFEFGQNGKPVYVAGPNDSQAMQMQVLETLQKLGTGNYDYIVFPGRSSQKRDSAYFANGTDDYDDDEDFDDGEQGGEPEQRLFV